MLWLVDRFHSLVELLCIPMQRSQRLVRCCWVPLGSRLSALWDRVNGGSGEGGRRVSEGVGAGGRRDRHGYWLLEDWGFSVLLALEEDEFVVKKSRFRVRLNSEKDGRWIGSFTFYEEPVAETLRLPWWLQCV